MSGIVIDGVAEHVPGLEVYDWQDDPKIKLSSEDGRARRTKWVRAIMLHTTRGDMPQVVHAHQGPEGLARRTVAAWGNDSRHAGAHLIVDGDGSIWCLADLIRDVTFHATSMNECSIGIEFAQTSRMVDNVQVFELYQSQIDAGVKLLDWLTLRLGIQRGFHGPYLGEDHPVARLAKGGVDCDCVGIFGHRDQTIDRSEGDPGNAIFDALFEARYERHNFDEYEDQKVWALRQRMANRRGAQLKVDGVPGPATIAALRRYMQRPAGLWVTRPCDAAAMTVA